MERAKVVQESIAPQFPSFVKTMVYSNVTHGFCVKFPRKFCHLHLPWHDITVTLVNENGEEYKTSFLMERTSISAGWRKFSLENKLLEGDVLVFHMVQPSKFKVYTVRANGLREIDGALCLLILHTRLKQMDYEVNQLKPLPQDCDQEQHRRIVRWL